MKILAIGDPHGKLPKNLASIIKRNKIKIIVCTGDIPDMPEKAWEKESWTKKWGQRADKSYKDIIRELCSFKIPVITLKGNTFSAGDSLKFTRKIFGSHKNLYHKLTGKYDFFGQEFILFDITSGPAWKNNNYIIKRRNSKLNILLKQSKDSILICHEPPYGILDIVCNEFTNYKRKHVGSKILFKLIKKYQPKLVLCAHLHESKGKGKIGKTKVFNLGSSGNYAIIDTNKNKVLESNFLK